MDWQKITCPHCSLSSVSLIWSMSKAASGLQNRVTNRLVVRIATGLGLDIFFGLLKGYWQDCKVAGRRCPVFLFVKRLRILLIPIKKQAPPLKCLFSINPVLIPSRRVWITYVELICTSHNFCCVPRLLFNRPGTAGGETIFAIPTGVMTPCCPAALRIRKLRIPLSCISNLH